MGDFRLKSGVRGAAGRKKWEEILRIFWERGFWRYIGYAEVGRAWRRSSYYPIPR
jgi:hypothetical protein